MAKANGGELIARVMKENRVKYCFAINGGHLFPILAELRSHDIKLIHMRHEQATAYAADAYARVSGETGVCMVTAGCGLTNAVTGLCTGALTGSSIVCISGQHPNTEDHVGSFQEAYGSEVVDSFAKFTKRVTDWTSIQFDLRSAFREAISPPQGVALFEIPQNILYHGDDDSKQRKGARGFTIEDVRSQGEPSHVDKALEILQCGAAPAHRGRRRAVLVAGRSRDQGIRRADRHPGLHAARGPGRGIRRKSARDSRLVEEALHRTRRCGHGDRLPLLERREIRPASDLDRQGEVHPDRSRCRPASDGRSTRTCPSSAIRRACCAR